MASFDRPDGAGHPGFLPIFNRSLIHRRLTAVRCRSHHARTCFSAMFFGRSPNPLGSSFITSNPRDSNRCASASPCSRVASPLYDDPCRHESASRSFQRLHPGCGATVFDPGHRRKQADPDGPVPSRARLPRRTQYGSCEPLPCILSSNLSTVNPIIPVCRDRPLIFLLIVRRHHSNLLGRLKIIS